MKRQVLKFDDIKGMLNDDEMRAVLGGITFNDFYELMDYIAKNGITSDIANKHFEANGAFGLNSIDIVQSAGHGNNWGFWANSSNSFLGNYEGGQNLPTAEVNSTWIPIIGAQSNALQVFLESSGKAFYRGDGYTMAIKNSSDMTYENFWNKAFAAFTGATLAAVSGGLSTLVTSYVGAIPTKLVIGGALGGIGGALAPSTSSNSEINKVRNDLVISALQDNYIAFMTQGQGLNSTLKFTNTTISAIALSIDMADLMRSVKQDMENFGYINSDGQLVGAKGDSYLAHFKETINGVGDVQGLISKLGGISSRGSYGGNSGSTSNGNQPSQAPGDQPMPNLTPISGDVELYFTYSSNEQIPLDTHEVVVTKEYVSTMPGVITEDGVFVDNNGDRWLMVYCGEMHPRGTDGTNFGIGSGSRTIMLQKMPY
ncbi:hypothetical protein ACFOG5_18125 [Pedobacter fastidiosus]|uniref:Uncharacterized protein n=1 Tax=Pedobacter fastidiosus TaxID=2765361 RepID=A0ABR7KSK0_9SPHI|nr:hypothetical protein [Pedobacter fastidiosus]MBC6111001.1 hypothetical protein [Pedobacter fastidiosus]